MKWTRDRSSFELLGEPTYSFASKDNLRAYDEELLLVRRDSVTSRHGLISFLDGARAASIVVGTGGGATGVHERSAVLVDGLCFAAVGPELVCLTVPTLEVRWHHEVDPATCFGLHLTPGEATMIVHGELESSKWTFDGQRLWSFGGADIFAGALSVVGGKVVVEDFDGRAYWIDLSTGGGELDSA